MNKTKSLILLVIAISLIVFGVYKTVVGINRAIEHHKYARQQAFKDGYNCAGAGIPVKANPHDTDSHKYLSWQRGWIAGKMGKVNLYEE